MADSKDDDYLDDEDLKNRNDDDLNSDELTRKYDDKFSYHDHDDNEMYTMYLKKADMAKVKIDEVEDYYDLFVDILKREPG